MPRKNWQKTLISSLLFLALSSCAMMPGAPAKPNVELGVIDYPSAEVITNMTGRASFKYIDSVAAANYRSVVTAIVNGGNRVPLATYDRAICFKPKHWEQVQNYTNALVRHIQNHCQQ